MNAGPAIRLLEVTPAHAATHAAVLAALHGAAFPDAPWGAAAFAGALGQPGAFGFIAVHGTVRGDDGEDEDPLGFVLMRAALFKDDDGGDSGDGGGEAEVLSIATRPDRRRRGVARTLMEAALTRARALGATRVFLEVAADNLAAQRLYASLEFAEVGRRKAYYARAQGPRADALVLALDL